MILLDTNAWIFWAANPERLSTPAAERIEREAAGGAIVISSISAWEVALLVQRGRLVLDRDPRDWIGITEALPYLRFARIDVNVAVRSVALPPEVGRDPADRMIVATAQVLGVPLVTSDRRLRDFGGVETLW